MRKNSQSWCLCLSFIHTIIVLRFVYLINIRRRFIYVLCCLSLIRFILFILCFCLKLIAWNHFDSQCPVPADEPRNASLQLTGFFLSDSSVSSHPISFISWLRSLVFCNQPSKNSSSPFSRAHSSYCRRRRCCRPYGKSSGHDARSQLFVFPIKNYPYAISCSNSNNRSFFFS